VGLPIEEQVSKSTIESVAILMASILTVETTEVSRNTKRDATVRLISKRVNVNPVTGSVLSVLGGSLVLISRSIGGACVFSIISYSRLGGSEMESPAKYFFLTYTQFEIVLWCEDVDVSNVLVVERRT